MNREAYDAIAAQWEAARTTFFGIERRLLDTFLDGLPSSSPILDLGCGTGCPIGSYLTERGHRLTGVDQSAAMLAHARQRLPQARWIEARIEDYTPDECYAGIVCWDALFHIDREWHAPLFERMAAMLLPAGRVILTVGGSAHPAFTDTMYGHRFFYDSHPPQKAVDLLERRGFRALAAEFINPPTDGRDKGRFAIVAALA